MNARKMYYGEYHVAGRQYYDADEVWEELKVGTQLSLVRDTDNCFDKNAVAIVYNKKSECIDAVDDEYVLGYIPRNENGTIAPLLDMGWNDIFECRISMIDNTQHYEEQLHVTVRIKRNPNGK